MWPSIRQPTVDDGRRVHGFIASCPPLDRNSPYCNLLQCTHFADTCALAETAEGVLVGWVGGYRVPSAPDALFVWQIAVAESMRGRHLAPALVLDVLGRPVCRDVRYVHATVTETNASSRRMFEGLATHLDAPLEQGAFFDGATHFGDPAATEQLLRIGPFGAPRESELEVG